LDILSGKVTAYKQGNVYTQLSKISTISLQSRKISLLNKN